ncbi:MAG: class I SAM-dependent methyltransferase [Anaerolineales bacterium]
MKLATSLKPDYGNWVSKKFILVPGILCLVFLGLAFLTPFMAIAAVLFLLIFGYFLYARFLFSPAGKDVQSQVVGLIMDHFEWDGQGQILDIGCGNAPLTIRLAKKFPASKVTGLDYWGKNWDYSKQICEQNAKIEGVGERTSFQKASASALPFNDGSFDLVVSNLTFHEVGDTKDKREVLQEALRVVRLGGRFVFQDLFLLEAIYGKPDELVALVKSWGIRKVEFVRTCDEPFIPALLKLPFMVGRIGIICGEK